MNGVAESENLGKYTTKSHSNHYSLKGVILGGVAFKYPGIESSLGLCKEINMSVTVQ